VIRVYRADWSTNCERVGLALAFKGIEVESVVIDYNDRSEVERVSGQGLVPVLEENGEVVIDSTAILRWLEERRPEPPMYPGDQARRTEVDLVINWFNEIWKRTANTLEAELEKTRPDHEKVEALAETLDVHLGVFERLLSGRDYLMGDSVSAADFTVFPFLKYATRSPAPGDDEPYHEMLDRYQSPDGRPRLVEWIDRVDALPRAY
jgi:glutathione S-transferase